MRRLPAAVACLAALGMMAATLLYGRAYSITSFNSGGHGDEEWVLASVLAMLAGTLFACFIVLKMKQAYRVTVAILLTPLLAIALPFASGLLGIGAFFLFHPLYCRWDSHSPTFCYHCAEAQGLSEQEITRKCGS